MEEWIQIIIKILIIRVHLKKLYYDKNQFMYPSLFTYAIKDILNIDYLMWLSICKHLQYASL